MSDLSAIRLREQVSMRTKLAYGFGAWGKDFSLNVMNVFLFFYLTDVAKVSPVAVGTIFLIARIWDTVNDPIFGYIVAKCNSRWGKYKPWIFCGNILNAAFLTACFCTHYFEGTAQLIYLTAVYIGWGMAYTSCDAPYWCMVVTITADKDERERLLPYPRLTATAANYISSSCGLYAVYLFGGEDKGFGYAVFGALAGVFAIISAVVACRGVEEKHEASGGADFSIKDAMHIIHRNRQFLIFLALALCFNLGSNLVNAMNLYFFKYVLEDEGLFSTMMMSALLITIPSLVFFKPMVDRIGRRTIFAMAISFPFLSCVLLALPAIGMAPALPMAILAGLVTGFSTSLYWLLVMIMVADTVDYGDLHYNMRSESIYYALHTLLSKCAGAVSGLVIGFFLMLVNYVPDTVQTPETQAGLTWLYVLPSLLCVAGLVIYMLFYRLNGVELDRIRDGLSGRGAKADPGSEKIGETGADKGSADGGSTLTA